MINTSNEYKQAIRKSGKKQYCAATVTLANGTTLTLDNSNIMENGLTINDGTSASDSFQIGSATINELALLIDNRKGEFSTCDFTNAIIRPSIGLQLSETVETLNKGVFTVDESKSIGGTISITALDNMHKFDTPFSDVSIAFPCTALQLLQAVCLYCGVSLATATFTNSDFIINRRPDDEAITCREIIAWIAQMGGNFARCNIDGALELKWYDMSAFEQSDSLDGGMFDNGLIDITKIEGASYQEVTVQGKNICPTDFSEWESGDYDLINGGKRVYESRARVKRLVKVNPSTTYYFNTFNTNPVYDYDFIIREYDNNGTFIRSIGEVLDASTITISSTGGYIGISIGNTPNDTLTHAIIQEDFAIGAIQPFICLNSVIDKAYAPFVPNSPSPDYPSPIISAENFDITASNGVDENSVNVPYVLRSLPSGIKDTFEVIDGVLTHVKRVNEVVFDGSADEGWGVNLSLNSKTRYTIKIPGIKPSASNDIKANALCSHFLALTNNQTYALNTGMSVGVYATNNTVYFYHPLYSNEATANTFKTWLQSNPITVQYELATPVYTPIAKLTLTSYGDATTITTNAVPQVVIQTDAYYQSGDIADGGNFTDYNSGDNIDGGTFLQAERYHHIYALSQATIGTDDVVITGVQVKATGTESDYGETVLFGSTGYVIEIVDNPLIQEGDAATIANSVGAKIVGMRFRPLSISALSDPSIEAGDVAYVSDRKGNSYQTLITNLSYTIGNYESISCDAETPSKKNSVRFSPQTKSIVEARKVAKQEISTYDLSVKQLNDLVMHSFGTYRTTDTLEDGSTIEYAHDKPTLAESQNIWKQTAETFTVSNDGGTTWRGMDADGNMVVTVLNAIGINAEWINVGTLSGIRIEANTGKIGPYDISDTGLTSDTMQFFDDGNYPLIWITKPGTGGWGSEGSARANYEPSVSVVRSIEDGIETDVYLMARDDATGTKGKIAIERYDKDTLEYVSRVEISDDGFSLQKYGASMSQVIVDESSIMFFVGDNYFSIVLDPGTSATYLTGIELNINGYLFSDLVNRILTLENNLSTANGDIANLEFRVSQLEGGV